MTTLDLNSLPNLTTAQRDAIAAPEVGDQIWNTTTSQIETYDGANWVGASAASVMTGTDGIATDGVAGLVPAPVVADGLTRFLASDGSFKDQGRQRVFASETSVAPALAGSPTVAEIQTWRDNAGLSGLPIDRIIFYTGTDTDTDTPTHVYHVDLSGDVTLIHEPASASAPVDDQAASGYFDIGTMRIQWGRQTISIGTTVTYPVPFAATPSVVITANDGGNGQVASINGANATSFTASAVDVNGSARTFVASWQAIGLKP